MCLWIVLGLSLLVYQVPQMLLPCIDYRYITDILTEKYAFGDVCVSCEPERILVFTMEFT